MQELMIYIYFKLKKCEEKEMYALIKNLKLQEENIIIVKWMKRLSSFNQKKKKSWMKRIIFGGFSGPLVAWDKH